jgi:hypothetical protein
MLIMAILPINSLVLFVWSKFADLGHSTPIRTIVPFVVMVVSFIIIYFTFKKIKLKDRMPDNFKTPVLMMIGAVFSIVPIFGVLIVKLLGLSMPVGLLFFSYTSYFSLIGNFLLVIAAFNFLLSVQPIENKI